MSTNKNAPNEIIIDGVKISPDLLEQLKDLQNFGSNDAKNCIARNCLFIAGLRGACEEIDRDFFFLQEMFYELFMVLNGDSNGQEVKP
jgi:hypothetical protein